jgi:pimeloyl-ACP methyl ester carboxylesterase
MRHLQDVVDFITAKKLVKPLVFGWSMGGIITQTILKNYNGLLGGVALLGTIPHASYTSQEFINLLANSDKLHPNEFRTQLYGMFFSATPSPELKDFITSAALNIEDYHYRFNFEAKELQDYAVVSWPGMDQVALNEIDVPTLILHAKNDLVIAPEACQILAREIPDSKLIIYSSGGHFFLHRNPLMIARDVCNFFLCQAE